MRPRPFSPESLNGDVPYVRDKTGGLTWHCCGLRVPYADVDRLQVVYHANYLRYFEFGRASLMRDTAYPYRVIEENGYNYPIISTGVDYFHPLHYDDLMRIYTRPAEMERVKLRFDYIITHAESGKIACIGHTKHCAVNASGIPVEIDPKTVHLWEIFPK